MESSLSTSSLSAENITIKLDAGSEWRFEVEFTEEVTLKVTTGVVEINGTELPNNFEFKFKGKKISIYCQQNAEIVYHGSVLSEYVSDESMMKQYISLHFGLQNFRQKSRNGSIVASPRVLIIGGKDSGKTTLSQILAAYAVKMDETPLLVNLNPNEGVYSIPGTLTATAIGNIFDVEEGWGPSSLTNISMFHQSHPGVVYYGYDDYSSNPTYYKFCLRTLSKMVKERLNSDVLVRNSGIIVNTPPVDNKNFALINQFVKNFNINLIIVLGNERLFLDLKKSFKDKIYESIDGKKPFFNILKFVKSMGCVDKDDSFIRAQQQHEFKKYFYGERKTILSPYTISFIDYGELEIKKIIETNKQNYFSINEENQLDVSSVLPIGESMGDDEKALQEELEQSKKEALAAKNVEANDKRDEEVLKQIEESDDGVDESKLIEPLDLETYAVQNSVIAFTNSIKGSSITDTLTSGIKCFGYVRLVNSAKKKVNILLPTQGQLPENNIMLGGFKYVD